jgi:hypothetical protein
VCHVGFKWWLFLGGRKKEVNERACRFGYRSLFWSFNKEGRHSVAEVWTSNEQPEVCGGISANKDLLK